MIRLIPFPLLLCLLTTTSIMAGESPPVERILKTQANAWNDGDIDTFMKYYWNSPNLTFSSGGKTTRGWQQTLKNYKKRYPNKVVMGKLRFSDLEITPLGKDAALVLGQWHLTRKMGNVSGAFSLIFRRIDGNWVIVHDHTSRLED